ELDVDLGGDALAEVARADGDAEAAGDVEARGAQDRAGAGAGPEPGPAGGGGRGAEVDAGGEREGQGRRGDERREGAAGDEAVARVERERPIEAGVAGGLGAGQAGPDRPPFVDRDLGEVDGGADRDGVGEARGRPEGD